MPKDGDEASDAQETWPEVMRVGTVARYLDCSTSTVSKMINDGTLPSVQYGSNESMRGVRRQDLEAYVEGLRPDVTFPEIEFEFSRSPLATARPHRGPGSRLLFLKRVIRYFEQDRDSWKRRALYSEKRLESTNNQLLSQLERLLPEPPALDEKSRQGRQRMNETHDVTTSVEHTIALEKYLEDPRKADPSIRIKASVRKRPGEFEELTILEFPQRMEAFWDLPGMAPGKLVSGGWLSREEVAQATNVELLATEGLGHATLRAIRAHIPKESRNKRARR